MKIEIGQRPFDLVAYSCIHLSLFLRLMKHHLHLANIRDDKEKIGNGYPQLSKDD